jgi:HK97 family phage prohead protease
MTITDIEVPRLLNGPQFRSATIEGDVNEDERVITMRAVPYDVETQIDTKLFESFEPGAFSRAAKDPARVKLWLGHSTTGGHLVGQAFEVEDRGDGVWVRARVSRTVAGDELLTLARDGVLDEASIEFNPIREAMQVERRGSLLHVRHKRGHLRGVGLVPHGAYGRHALVTSVRDDQADAIEAARAEAIARLTGLTH